MKHKYIYLSLIIILVFTLTFNSYNEHKNIQNFWQTNNTECDINKGCSEVKVRPGYGVGDTIPDINLYTIDKEKVRLYDLVKGKKNIYLNFTTDWCETCNNERKNTSQLIKNLDSDSIIIPIFVTFKSEKTNIDQITQFIRDNHFDYPVYIDINNNLLNKFKINGTPTNVYIDQTGRIKIIAQELDVDELVALINKKGGS